MMNVLEHSSYLVKMDKSGRLSKRRHLFLKPMVAHKNVLVRQSSGSSELPMGMSLWRGKQTGVLKTLYSKLGIMKLNKTQDLQLHTVSDSKINQLINPIYTGGT